VEVGVGPVATSSGEQFSLEDRYRREAGAVYVTGIQALVRMLLDRARADQRAGRATATYVTGYEGSPLGGLDLELARQAALLAEHAIVAQPGLNEELAATAVAGTQLARQAADLRYAGVTGVWYGKTPGLDRASDALRHANLIGTDPHGGALALAGDDPAAKSSTVPGSSELALADLGMPTFVPADAAEILQYGQHAVELSRASGLWAALKIATVVADGAATAAVTPWSPPDLTDLPGGLTAYAHRPTAHLLGATLAGLERSFHQVRLPLAREYARRSGVNKITGPAAGRIGIISAGASYLALRQALTSVGLGQDRLEGAGIRLLKLGMVFPLEPSIVREFARGLDQIIVVEEKRAFLEDAVKSVLYGMAGAPAVYGKHGPDGRPLLPPFGELDSGTIADGLSRCLTSAGVPDLAIPAPPRQQTSLPLAARTPFFCSGCPHNSSTEVAPGTLVGGGIGCHAMVLLMPGEQRGQVTGLTQMGGEGAHWIGMAPFVGQRHFVQNIGDGTFAHSGSLAIRAAVAAGVNVTFKLLRNSAVAMTGGQRPVGELSLRQLTALLQAEGVRRIVVTSDDPQRLRGQAGDGIAVRHRDDLLAVQQELAATGGVTVLIHDQECAAEKRRKRRRGQARPPAQRVFINERVCEGCGDCGVKSNCLSVQPVATEFGRKTRISQSSCNLDFSCLSGDCPSFLTVIPRPGVAREPGAVPAPGAPGAVTAPDEPGRVVPEGQFSMRITGIGGTGVVTVSQVLATAAAIEGRSVRTLDQTGLAQKGGAVVSDLTITRGEQPRSPKLGVGECDLYLGCDALVAADPANLQVTDARKTVAVISLSEVPTGSMVVTVTARYPGQQQIRPVFGEAARDARFIDAAALALEHLGDEQYANMIMVGAAYQCGALPIAAASIERAIGLNAVAVPANLAAFRHGRHAVAGQPAPSALVGQPGPGAGEETGDLEALIRRRTEDLVAYQDESYAAGYAELVGRVREAEAGISPGLEFTTAVARNLYKLMAYKDEYEVARLSVDPQLTADITAQFGAGARYRYRLHPPVLRSLGMTSKISLGPWFRPGFRLLAAGRRLRGTPWDPFGRTRVRRTERALVSEYRAITGQLLTGLTTANHALAVEIAGLPDLVRGYEEIKLGNVAAYRDRAAELLARFSAGAQGPASA
jgi:indolepyruvate ferredoxin oxidoreductase